MLFPDSTNDLSSSWSQRLRQNPASLFKRCLTVVYDQLLTLLPVERSPHETVSQPVPTPADSPDTLGSDHRLGCLKTAGSSGRGHVGRDKQTGGRGRDLLLQPWRQGTVRHGGRQERCGRRGTIPGQPPARCLCLVCRRRRFRNPAERHFGEGQTGRTEHGLPAQTGPVVRADR